MCLIKHNLLHKGQNCQILSCLIFRGGITQSVRAVLHGSFRNLYHMNYKKAVKSTQIVTKQFSSKPVHQPQVPLTWSTGTNITCRFDLGLILTLVGLRSVWWTWSWVSWEPGSGFETSLPVASSPLSAEVKRGITSSSSPAVVTLPPHPCLIKMGCCVASSVTWVKWKHQIN